MGSTPGEQLSLELANAPTHLPSGLRPMLPKPADAPFDDPAWLFEPSWEGLRALAHVEAGRLRLVDPRGRDVTARFPELLGLIDAVRGAPAVLDGEIVTTDEAGRPDPDALRRRLRSDAARAAGRKAEARAVYLADDLIVHEARLLLREPLARRVRMLATALRPSSRVVVMPSVEGEGRSLYEAVEAQGLRAMLARRADSPYLPGVRSDLWRHIRTAPRFEAVVGGYAARSDGSVSLLLGAWQRRPSEDDRFVAIGVAEAAAGSDLARSLERTLRRLTTPVTPFQRGARAEYRWVRPELVVSLEHRGWSAGRLLSPRLSAVRDELDARACRLPDVSAAAEQRAGMARRPLLALLQRLPLGEE